MKSPEEYGTRVRCYRHVHACMVKDVSLLLSIAYDNEFLGQAGCANENAWKLGIKRTRLNRTLFSSDTRLETSNPTNGWIPRVKGTVRVHSWVSMAFIGSFEHVLFHNGYHSLQTVPGFECFIHVSNNLAAFTTQYIWFDVFHPRIKFSIRDTDTKENHYILTRRTL